MTEDAGCKRSRRMWTWDLVVVGAFVLFDDLRNAVLVFLATQDVLSLILILAIAWYFYRMQSKIGSGLGGAFGGFDKKISEMGLFDGFLQKHEAK